MLEIIFSDNETKEDTASGISEDKSTRLGEEGASEDEGAVDMIRRYLAEKLGFYEKDSERKPKVSRLHVI